MSNKFIAYFDYLGFKDFIMNNSGEYHIQHISNIFRDIENALAKRDFTRFSEGGVVANMDNSNLHCINFSDTVIFYSEDDSIESLKEILEVAYIFNWQCVDYFFPVRGCLYFGEAIDAHYNAKTGKKGSYNVNSIIGKGLVNAYLKAESQNWAGTVIDNTVIEYMEQHGVDVTETISQFAKKYTVPYKHIVEQQTPEWVMNLVQLPPGHKLNDVASGNMQRTIRENFGRHNKKTDSDRVKEIIENTIDFIRSYT